MSERLLERIESPADVRALSRAEVVQLCAELREEIVQRVAKTGGHLASSQRARFREINCQSFDMGNHNSGRRPQPTKLKVLRGNPSKTRLNEREPVPPDGEVVMPAGLSPDACRMWEEISPVCLAMGTLTPADVSAFAKLCELEATARAASAQKAMPGFTIFLHTTMVDSAGNEHQQVKVHPAIKIEGETSVKLRPYYEYFGLTPSGRARLSVPKRPEAPVSKWAGALK